MNNNLELVKRLYVNNGEYKFDNELIGNKFAEELLSNIENTYQYDGYHQVFENLEGFIYSSFADDEAYWLYVDKFSDQ